MRSKSALAKVKREAKTFGSLVGEARLARARLEVAVLEAKVDGWHFREIADASETFSHVTARTYAGTASATANGNRSVPTTSPINTLRRMRNGSRS